MSPLSYPQADTDADQARAAFRYTGGVERLTEPWRRIPELPSADLIERHWAPGIYRHPLEPRPWVYRFGEASAGTGSRYAALATRVHADVASREGGPVILTVLSPWQDAHAFALDGWLDESYVAEHLTGGRARETGRLHAGDLTALTMLLRILLGREEP